MSFESPTAPDLNLIDTSSPSTEFASASAYASPHFNATPTPASSGSGMMFASMALSSIGAITTAFGQARALRARGDYEATIARTNASIAELQGKQTLEQGDLEASRRDLQTHQTVGAIKAQQGASGVDAASGSSALVRNAVQGAGAIDELTIRNNAARKAWGYQTEAINDTFKGQFAELTAKAGAEQSLMTGGLEAISAPLAMFAKYKYMQKYLGVRGSSDISGMSGGGPPFPNMATS